ncbi:MAG: metallophosphoesterase [Armatimonadota bacterium]
MIVVAVLLWLAVIAALAVVWYVRYVEPTRIELTRTQVHFEGLPAAFDGLTIAHLADFHCHPDPAIERSSRLAVELAMAQAPDLIVIAGDMFETCEAARTSAWQLDGLAAPLGVWAVPGNHDLAHRDPYATVEAPPREVALLREVLAEGGITLLVNESRTIEVDGARLAIAGVDEYAFGRDDARRALARAANADLIILLAHTPDLLDDPWARRAHLILCGHTHGGQIQLPRIGSPWAPVWRDRRRSSGLLRAGRALCYVSRGVASATPARFNCRPEVAILTLRPGPEPAAREVPVREARMERHAAVEEVVS